MATSRPLSDIWIRRLRHPDLYSVEYDEQAWVETTLPDIADGPARIADPTAGAILRPARYRGAETNRAAAALILVACHFRPAGYQIALRRRIHRSRL